ncbi:monocarboxylate transporter 13-like isoform X3 [Dermochelys coriacea]|uniref:monocarboxylate transporter 13-like isoform X3 n=1 Tax=Dermochelys coriacea TaxID=27794 RepID=UPI0018E73B74|nr:monocarboxylate transporter 13-like isoform X3 [Dermochelys coriacea]
MPVVHPEPPDGGWGWMVVLAAFFQSALVFGVIRSFGVFFMEFVGYFGELAGQVSWITSIGIAVQQFASPVGSALSTQYGARPVVMAGGILSGLGMLLASFATSLTHLYLSIGLLSGFGWALVFTPSVASVARYFKKRRTFATGLAFTGVGLSSFAFSPLFQLLVDTYAWRGALLVVAGMSFNLVVCGALIRPLTLKEDLASPGDPGGSCLGKLSTLFGLSLLFHWPFMRLAAGHDWGLYSLFPGSWGFPLGREPGFGHSAQLLLLPRLLPCCLPWHQGGGWGRASRTDNGLWGTLLSGQRLAIQKPRSQRAGVTARGWWQWLGEGGNQGRTALLGPLNPLSQPGASPPLPGSNPLFVSSDPWSELLDWDQVLEELMRSGRRFQPGEGS